MPHRTDNISADTQMVSLVELRGTHYSLAHPRGAVGVVTCMPTGDEEYFKAHPGAADVSRLTSTVVHVGERSGLTVAVTTAGDFERALNGIKLTEQPDHEAANGSFVEAREEMVPR